MCAKKGYLGFYGIFVKKRINRQDVSEIGGYTLDTCSVDQNNAET
jgi:hypothetical protein